MTKKYNNVCELIGGTPMVRLNGFGPEERGEIFVKLESFNPGSSVKDRIALAMLEAAEQQGELKADSTIIEPTSGNTGIGLAMVAAVKGYKIILVMPESMSVERRKILQGLGAELVLTDASEGMQGAVDEADKLAARIPNSFIPQQFKNNANPQIHYQTTAPEIWKDTDGNIDVFVAGVGTGGTVSGVGKFLKEKSRDIYIVAVEPEESPVLSAESAGPHMIQGIGAGFVPDIMDMSVVDEVAKVSSIDAINTAKSVIKQEGLMVGISSGANICVTLRLARRPENLKKCLVTIAPDTSERYLSTLLYYDD